MTLSNCSTEGTQPYPLPFAICIGTEPSCGGAALPPFVLPLPASVEVHLPVPLAKRLVEAGCGLSATLSAGGGGGDGGAPLSDFPIASPAQLAALVAAAAAAQPKPDHLRLWLPLPPLRALRAADPPRLTVLLRRWRPAADAVAGGPFGSSPADAAPAGSSLVAALPLLLLPSPACCAEVQGLLPAALDAATEEVGAGAAPPDVGAVFGGRVGPLLFDLSEALARPRAPRRAKDFPSALVPRASGDAAAADADAAGLAAALLPSALSCGMPHCARLLLPAADAAVLGPYGGQLWGGAGSHSRGRQTSGVGGSEGSPAASPRAAAAVAAQPGRGADPYATPPPAPPPVGPPRISWLRPLGGGPGGGGGKDDSDDDDAPLPRGIRGPAFLPAAPSTTPETLVAALATLLGPGPPAAPVGPGPAPAGNGAAGAGAGIPAAALPPAPGAASLRLRARPGERLGLLRACLSGFIDPSDEAGFSVLKFRGFQRLAAPLLALEAAALLMPGSVVMAAPRQLAPLVCCMATVLLCVLALLLCC